MHELTLSRAIVDTALRYANGARVTVVRLRVGALRQVVPDSLEFYFEIVARETACAGARVELEVTPAQLRCSACGSKWTLERPPFWCPECGSYDVRVEGGLEFELESIETEEAPCTASM